MTDRVFVKPVWKEVSEFPECFSLSFSCMSAHLQITDLKYQVMGFSDHLCRLDPLVPCDVNHSGPNVGLSQLNIYCFVLLE